MEFLSPPESFVYKNKRGTLAEHLGFDAKDHLVIINADDFGISVSANEAVSELFQSGRITSTSIMVPSSAYEDAVACHSRHGGFPTGVHITLTSDFRAAPSKPVSPCEKISSLLIDRKYFRFGREAFFSCAILEEAQKEAVLQIEKAHQDGIDVTHLDSHEGTLQLKPEFAQVFLLLAELSRLPMRSGSKALLARLGLNPHWIDQARQRRILGPDNLVYIPICKFASFEERRLYLDHVVDALQPGVTEFYFHPSLDCAESQMLALSAPDADELEDPNLPWKARLWDYQILSSGHFHDRLRKRGVRFISYRPLRDLMREF